MEHCTIDHSRKHVDPVEAVVGGGGMITLAVTVALLCGSVFGHDIIVNSPMYGHKEFWQASSSRGPLAELRALAPPVKPRTAVTPDVDNRGWSPEAPTVRLAVDVTPPESDELHVTLASATRPAAPANERGPAAAPERPVQAVQNKPALIAPAKPVQIRPAAPAVVTPREPKPAASAPIKSQRPVARTRPARATVAPVGAMHPTRRGSVVAPHRIRSAPHVAKQVHAPRPVEQRIDASEPTTSHGRGGRTS